MFCFQIFSGVFEFPSKGNSRCSGVLRFSSRENLGYNFLETMEDNSIKWIGYEYEHSEKSSDWFWAVGIITICLAVIAIIYDNTLFGIFMVLAGFMTMMLAKRPPDIVQYALTPKGVMVDDTIYLYKDLQSFWVDTHIKETPELLIKTKKAVARLFIFPIPHATANPHEIRDYLLQALPEEHMEDPLSHRLLVKMGL